MVKNGVVITILVLAALFLLPWKNISWGKLTLSQERMITVTGYAESRESNQIARFSAGVTALNDKKEAAVNEVNSKMEALIKEVKAMGIDEDDIQTSRMNVYQMQEEARTMIYPPQNEKMKLGQWSANNSVEITLRDVNKASELADLLNKSGANNIYGPNFSLDTSNKAADKLLGEAIADSRSKAEEIAKAGGAKLGYMVTVVEGGANPVIYPMMSAKAGLDSVSVRAPMEPGTTNISKSVTVVWSLQ